MKKLFSLCVAACLVFSFFTGCTKDSSDPNPVPPVANAGPYQIIQLPGSATVTGSGTTTNGSITGYLWSLVSGLNVPVITSPSSATTTVTDLVAGTYIFQFAVTDNTGLTGMDTVSMLVKAPLQQTITLQPANNANGGHADSYNLVGGTGGPELPIGSWTIGGTPTNWRSFVKFDQSQIPANATIISATLYLYSPPDPIAGNGTNAQFGTANAFYVEKITADWTGASLNWKDLPPTTATNRVLVPKSTSTTENAVINVTDIVQSMQSTGIYGFAFRLQNESYYNMRVYASSFHSNAAIHPKLVITYQ